MTAVMLRKVKVAALNNGHNTDFLLDSFLYKLKEDKYQNNLLIACQYMS